MKIKKLSLILGLTAILSFTGCGSSKYDTASAYDAAPNVKEYYDDAGMYVAEEVSPMADNSGTTYDNTVETVENATTTNRKLIKTVSLDAETKEYDSFLNNIESKVSELGGYIENLNVYNGSSYRKTRNARSASITARIPASSLNTFINTIGDHSNVTNRNENVQDITLNYVDMDSHKRMLEAERDRLLELLDQCETIEDMITVEERLTDIRYQIDSMESQLRTYDNLVDYSTVYLNISEVIDYTVVDTIEKTTWERISDGFTENLHSVMDGIKEFFVGLIINLPSIIMTIAIIAIIILIIKGLLNFNSGYRERKALRKEKKRAKKEEKAKAKTEANKESIDTSKEENNDSTVK